MELPPVPRFRAYLGASTPWLGNPPASGGLRCLCGRWLRGFHGGKRPLTQAQTPCQSRSERWPTRTGWVEGGSVAKKLRKTEETRKPACAQSCNRESVGP